MFKKRDLKKKPPQGEGTNGEGAALEAPKRAKIVESDSDSDGEDSAVVRKEKKSVTNPLFAKTSSNKRRDPLDEGGIDVKYEARITPVLTGDEIDATKVLEIDTERDRDAEALYQKQLQITKELQEAGKLDDNTYRGQAGYTKFIISKDAEHGSKFRVGPQRAASNIRVTNRFDYQPDICKDYKETGYCGYGDNCKFLHDRGDYKAGWQLDRDWEMQQKQQKEIEKYQLEQSSDEEDDLPFACLICREEFKRPVVTKCQHYFCEKCVLDAYSKSPNCPVCGQNTNGIFNTAKELIKKLAQKKERQGLEMQKQQEQEEIDATEVSMARRT